MITQEDIRNTLSQVVSDDKAHAQWVNTLSLMENCGAKLIKAGEHPSDVDLIVLKHAAEEARHAFYLKKQVRKLDQPGFDTYSDEAILFPRISFRYLDRLNVKVCKYLKKHFDFTPDQMRFAAYLLVTYAIEVRADELYPIYQEVLREAGSSISVKMIIVEEEGHLREMLDQMEGFFDNPKPHQDAVEAFEKEMFEEWFGMLMEKNAVSPSLRALSYEG